MEAGYYNVYDVTFRYPDGMVVTEEFEGTDVIDAAMCCWSKVEAETPNLSVKILKVVLVKEATV